MAQMLPPGRPFGSSMGWSLGIQVAARTKAVLQRGRRMEPGPTEFMLYWTVRGVRGNEFRVDHAFATPSLLAGRA